MDFLFFIFILFYFILFFGPGLGWVHLSKLEKICRVSVSVSLQFPLKHFPRFQNFSVIFIKTTLHMHIQLNCLNRFSSDDHWKNTVFSHIRFKYFFRNLMYFSNCSMLARCLLWHHLLKIKCLCLNISILIIIKIIIILYTKFSERAYVFF